MKKFAILASASALHLVNDKAPHEELVEVGTKVAQFYGFNPASMISQGYSWNVVGDVELKNVLSTFTNTGPAAMNVWYAVQGWGSSLQNNWVNTLQAAASANNATSWNSSNSTNSSSNSSSNCTNGWAYDPSSNGYLNTAYLNATTLARLCGPN